ncbi:hypothetical protein [Planktothrix mougeotii]|nr:hypothetical protein [Planktothrix mougeotii]
MPKGAGYAIAFLKKAIALYCNNFRESDRSLKKSDRTLTKRASI